MSREATQHERFEWWIAYGLDLRGFVPGGGNDGVVHWLADAYAHQVSRAELIRVCDMIWDDWSRRSGEEVSCMACIAESCKPIMMGVIR
jgi:hypothetical protein